jgi:hypothetical protein
MHINIDHVDAIQTCIHHIYCVYDNSRSEPHGFTGWGVIFIIFTDYIRGIRIAQSV